VDVEDESTLVWTFGLKESATDPPRRRESGREREMVGEMKHEKFRDDD